MGLSKEQIDLIKKSLQECLKEVSRQTVAKRRNVTDKDSKDILENRVKEIAELIVKIEEKL